MKSLKMGHGPDMPVISYGTWQVLEDKAAEFVKQALDVGYTHIDCAHIYKNEHEIGKVFGELKDRNGIFVTSKLWSNSHEPHLVKPACENTLKNLKLEALDLYLVHNPVRTVGEEFNSRHFKKEWILETWREMEKLLEAGLTKAVGVSNFTTTKLSWLLDEASVKPANNQVELHPYLPQNKLVAFCKENGILPSAYSSLGTPATAAQYPNLSSVPNLVLLEDATIAEIAKKNLMTSAQVLLSWGISRGTPVLCKSSSVERMKENFASAELVLPIEDIEKINNISHRCRYCDLPAFLTGGNTVDDFWDGERLL